MKSPNTPRKPGRGQGLREAAALIDIERSVFQDDMGLLGDDDDDDFYPDMNLDATPSSSALANFARDDDLAGMAAMWLALPDLNPNLAGRHFELPLLQAASRGRSEAVGLLLEMGADPCLPDRSGMTALAWAAQSCGPRSGEAVRMLVEAGADLESVHGYDETPFLSACRLGNLSAAQALFELGADIRGVDSEGRDALTLAHIRANRHSKSWPPRSASEKASEGPSVHAWLSAIHEREALASSADTLPAPARARPKAL